MMGVALWVKPAVPRWLAILFSAGLEVAQQQISSGPVVVLYMLPFAAALPASQPQLEPAGIPVWQHSEASGRARTDALNRGVLW
jgi:hypothetical protein